MQYDVVVESFRLNAAEPPAKVLARAVGVSPEEAKALLRRFPALVATRVDHALAERMADELRASGANVAVRRWAPVAAPAAPAPVQTAQVGRAPTAPTPVAVAPRSLDATRPVVAASRPVAPPVATPPRADAAVGEWLAPPSTSSSWPAKPFAHGSLGKPAVLASPCAPTVLDVNSLTGVASAVTRPLAPALAAAPTAPVPEAGPLYVPPPSNSAGPGPHPAAADRPRPMTAYQVGELDLGAAGRPTAVRAPPATAHGRPASVHGQPASFHGQPASVHGRASVVGSPPLDGTVDDLFAGSPDGELDARALSPASPRAPAVSSREADGTGTEPPASIPQGFGADFGDPDSAGPGLELDVGANWRNPDAPVPTSNAGTLAASRRVAMGSAHGRAAASPGGARTQGAANLGRPAGGSGAVHAGGARSAAWGPQTVAAGQPVTRATLPDEDDEDEADELVVECPMCRADNRPGLARCAACGARLEVLGPGAYTPEDIVARRYQQEGFTWRWVGIACATYLALQVFVLGIVPGLFPRLDPQGLTGLGMSVAIWFLGAIAIGVFSPGKTFVEPAVAAALMAVPSIAYQRAITPEGFEPSMLAYLVVAALGVMTALLGALVGERIQMSR